MLTQVNTSLAFLRRKKLDSLGIFLIWYSSFSSQILKYKGRIFLVFFSFLARNGLEFLVSREKSKCKKNATHTTYLNIYNSGQCYLIVFVLQWIPFSRLASELWRQQHKQYKHSSSAANTENNIIFSVEACHESFFIAKSILLCLCCYGPNHLK